MSPSHLDVTSDRARSASSRPAGISRCRGAFMGFSACGKGSGELCAQAAKPAALGLIWRRFEVAASIGGTSLSSTNQRIRVGVGGWTYEPWRDNFYPKGLPHAQELSYASRQLTAIEVNGTYYSTFKPRDLQQVARRDARRLHVLAQGLALRDQPQAAGDGGRFDQALRRQRHRPNWATSSGPIVWQFMPTKQFDAGGLRGLSRAAAEEGRQPHAAPRAGRAARELHDAGVPGARAQVQGGDGLHRLGQVSVLRGPDRPTSSMRA